MSERIIFENEIKSILESTEKLFDGYYHRPKKFLDPRSEYQEIHHVLENVKMRFPSIPGVNSYPRCKTCGFWYEFEGLSPQCGECRCPEDPRTLFVNADFGCVRHKVKE